ncbi:unnamed protein product [Dovyalis caffra]|uniref:Uncharacterized protein n=1 Tax=Dovyalis caffra TaxID=77055 RepID=A0AAV1SNZ5_9ROSI|nr:unnamed protein product [Dovyalis caffra]
MKILNILKRRGLPYIFVIVSIFFSIYHPEFPLSFQVWARTIEDSPQDSDVIVEFFHIPEAFDMDYKEMERSFKIFVYPNNATLCEEPRKLDGEDGNEGVFFQNLYQSRFLTKDTEKAHLFLIPSYCHSLPAEVELLCGFIHIGVLVALIWSGSDKRI